MATANSAGRRAKPAMPKAVAREVVNLGAAVKDVLPSKKLDRNLIIGT
ncbi:MAG: hypothetical protein M3011_07165 [Actinomycetota bacterium]|nr:hypothetical protein [Actinomycetota bacterium]